VASDCEARRPGRRPPIVSGVTGGWRRPLRGGTRLRPRGSSARGPKIRPAATSPAASATLADRRYDRDTPQFGRVANLSDGVFAIALTLLVLSLDRPDVPADQLAQALVGQLPQLAVVALGFLLIANVWWYHHRFLGVLRVVEPGLITINLAMLGAVALAPYAIDVLGSAPTSTAAVIQFTVVFAGVTALYLGLLLRARSVEAWLHPMNPRTFSWIAFSWLASLGIQVVVVSVALVSPVVAIVILAASGTVMGVVMAWIAPKGYHDWGL
jgi:uncharacterized membrane protein